MNLQVHCYSTHEIGHSIPLFSKLSKRLLIPSVNFHNSGTMISEKIKRGDLNVRNYKRNCGECSLENRV